MPEKDKIRASIEKLMARVPEKGAISVRTEKMVEFGRVPRKARIRPSIGKLFGRVPEKSPISVRIEKWLNPGEYREKLEFVRVSKNSSDEYRKRVQSVCVPKNCRIRVRNGKR